MVVLGAPLKTAAAPAGIFSLELNFGALPAMLASYSETVMRQLAFQLGLDFLFIPLYTSGLVLGIARTLQKRQVPPPAWMTPLAWFMWGAGALDALENASLYLACMGTPTTALGWGATAFAAPKFVIIVVGLAAWAYLALRHRKPSSGR